MNKVNVNQIFKNYRELCNYLGEPIRAGKSKQYQLKDWCRYFEYKQDGHKFTILEVYDEPKEKTQRTSNNIKNIKPMIEYLKGITIPFDDCYSFTDWYCDHLELLHRDVCNIGYRGEKEIKKYCNENNIFDDKLLCKYVSLAKSQMKNIFLKALKHLDKKLECEYFDGYKFVYQLGKRKRSLGCIITDELNDVIHANETIICDEMNKEHNLSDKMKGRQNLLVIYNNEKLTEQFDELKLSSLMKDENALSLLNDMLEYTYSTYHKDHNSICEERPLIAYNRVIAIGDIECEENDVEELAVLICNIVRQKVRKELFSQHYENKYTGEMVYPYINESCGKDILQIEKLLFQYFDETLVEDTYVELLEYDMLDADKVFGCVSDIGDDIWGEPCAMNYTDEEMLDMPIMSDLTM